MPGPDRHDDEGVDHAPATGRRVGDHPHPPEVGLELDTGLPIGHSHRRLGGTGAAPLGTEPLERPLRNRHPPPGEQIADLGDGEIGLHPGRDPLLLGEKPLPRRPMPVRPVRSDRLAHRADQLLGELALTAVAHEAERRGRLQVAAHRLAIDAGRVGDRAETRITTQPAPQHLFDLNH